MSTDYQAEGIRQPGHRRYRGISAVLLALCVGLAGCGEYPKVGPTTFELAKALYTVCNAKNAAQLERFRDLLRTKHQAGEVTDREREILSEIADTAETGAWQEAEQETRQLLLDQNEG